MTHGEESAKNRVFLGGYFFCGGDGVPDARRFFPKLLIKSVPVLLG